MTVQQNAVGLDAGPTASAHDSQETLSNRDAQAHQTDLEKAIDDPSKEKDNETSPKPPAGGPPSAPDGGLRAWLQVLGAFFLFFNSWGILNTFGVYQTYYESGALFRESSSNIAWIGSIQAYCVLITGLFTGPIYDRGYFKTLLVVGSFGIVFGHMMLSLSKTFWEALLSQGFCVGIGAGCIFVPSVAILPTYFSSKLGLAIGLAAAGSSLGGVIYPIAFYKLIDEVGFAWATRIIGFIALATLSISIVVMKMRFKPAKPRDFIDWTAFTDLHFATFTVGAMIGFIGMYTMFFYLSYFAADQHITSSAMSFYVVPILNAASTFGRTLPNALSDIVGPFNIIAPGALAVGILVLCMLAVTNTAGIVIVAILFGFFSGVFIALPPVCFVKLSPDRSKIGTRIGMGFAFVGFGTLCGGPAGGALLGGSPPLDWHGLWTYGGVTGIVASVIFSVLRFWRTGPKLFVKA